MPLVVVLFTVSVGGPGTLRVFEQISAITVFLGTFSDRVDLRAISKRCVSGECHLKIRSVAWLFDLIIQFGCPRMLFGFHLAS